MIYLILFIPIALFFLAEFFWPTDTSKWKYNARGYPYASNSCNGGDAFFISLIICIIVLCCV